MRSTLAFGGPELTAKSLLETEARETVAVVMTPYRGPAKVTKVTTLVRLSSDGAHACG